MALQDLTPQLRTRLSRMERAVGWFVIIATLLLAAGFAYYVYNTAQRKGWFLKKITYKTCVSSAEGLKVADPIKLMGYDVGDITEITPNDPYAYYNITITFRVKVDRDNYPGYIWTDSKVKVNSSDLLGNRFLEITKGAEGVPTVRQTSENPTAGILRQEHFKTRMAELEKQGRSKSEALALLNTEAKEKYLIFYTNQFRENIYFLDPLDSPAITERLEKFVSQVEAALPNILNLTNQISTVLSNSADLTANLNAVALDARPAVSNLALATAGLDRPGGLGDWLLPTNINQKLDSVVGGADSLMANANTNLANLNLSLIHLANITSNLNHQVQANSNMLSTISQAVQDADDLVQGLKRHWLLRSAFKTKKEEASSPGQSTPQLSPKDRGQR